MKNITLTALLSFSLSLQAQVVSLVKDINQKGLSQFNPSNLIKVGNHILFAASDGKHGQELWKTDGTDAGTEMVKDINPGIGYSGVYNPIVYKDKLFFTANDGTHGQELWCSDGSEQGTRLVKDIYPGTGNGIQIPNYTISNSLLFFIAEDKEFNKELWRTDGTEAGTFVVKDFQSGYLTIDGQNQLFSYNNELYFTPVDETVNRNLWKTDGTLAGTVRLTNSSTSPGFGVFAELNGLLYFMASADFSGMLLYRTDGTTAGTEKVAEFPRYTQEPGLTSAGGKLIFYLDNYPDYDVWTSDGTAAGTKKIKPFTECYYPAKNFFWYDGNFYFSSGNQYDAELWKTDGTEAGTHLIKDLEPGIYGSNPGKFCTANGDLYFVARTQSEGPEIYKTDGTYEGTSKITNLDVPAGYSEIENLLEFDNQLFYTAYISDKGFFIYHMNFDGSQLKVIDKTYKISGSAFGKYGRIVPTDNHLFFAANDSIHDKELWKTDGTEVGTVLVKDLNPEGPGVLDLTRSVVKDDILYFMGGEYDHGLELWRSDGTEEGTYMLQDMAPGNYNGFTGEVVTWEDHIWFVTGEYRNNLAVSDGTKEGTFRVQEMNLFGFNNIYSLTTLDDKLFFIANTDGKGFEPWVSDGTAAGTRMVKNIRTGDDLEYDLSYLSVLNGKVLFSARLDNGNEAIFTSDGTEAGTKILAETENDTPDHMRLVVLNNLAFFSSQNNKLWITDGTVEGTKIIKEVGSSQSHIRKLKAVNDLMYFAVWGEKQEIWVSDGSTEGTRKILSIDFGYNEYDFVDCNDEAAIIFEAYPGRMYSSDGTEAGTSRTFGDEYFPTTGNNICWKDQLYFIADNGQTGNELYKITYTNIDIDDTATETENRNLWANGTSLYMSDPSKINEIKVFNSIGQELYKTNPSTDSRIDLPTNCRGFVLVSYKLGDSWKSLKHIAEP